MDKRNIFRKTGSALTATLATIFAQAQGSGTHVNAESILTGAERTLKSLAGPIINVVSIIMGLVGVGMLGVNLYKYFKGDPTSNDALTKIGGGLLVAVIILQVINYTML